MKIRDATKEDAAAICELLIRSITELCEADHKNDPQILSCWLKNKIPDDLVSWMVDPQSVMLVVVDNGKIISVGP